MKRPTAVTGDVAITYGGHCHYGPIYTVGYIVEARAGYVALYHVHYCPHRSYQYQHEEKENQYLGRAYPQRAEQEVALVYECEQLEYTEYAYQSEGTYHEEVVRAGHEETHIYGQCSQKVNNTEKTEYVFLGLFQAVYSG